MAPKNAVLQSSRKATQSTSQGSTIASATSGDVVTRSITTVAAITTLEQSVVTVRSQSHKIQNFSSEVSDGVDQATAHALK